MSGNLFLTVLEIVLLAKQEQRVLVTKDLTLAKEQHDIIEGLTFHVFRNPDSFVQLKELVKLYSI